MVSIFPPKYSLTSVFNVSENVIIDIVEKGYSEEFYQKIIKLLDKYKNAIGIDEMKIPFITRLKQRCDEINSIEINKVNFDDELNKVINFLEEVKIKKENYFIEYINEGRRLKKINNRDYLNHKLKSITYI